MRIISGSYGSPIAAQRVRAVVSGRQRNAIVPFRRVELRYVEVRSRLMLQMTSYDETQAHIRNIEPGSALWSAPMLKRCEQASAIKA